jgi:hypothetical protein
VKKLELTQQFKDKIISLLEKGCTDKEIYRGLKINHNTFYNWLKNDTEFAETIKAIKRPLNVIVEASLFKRANGYKTKEITKELINGKMVKTKEVYKEVPPDTTSMIFWLKNKDRENYKDVSSRGVKITDPDNKFTIEISEIDGAETKD